MYVIRREVLKWFYPAKPFKFNQLYAFALLFNKVISVNFLHTNYR